MLFINVMVFDEVTVALVLDLGVERCMVKLIEKWSGISGVDIRNIVISGFG